MTWPADSGPDERVYFEHGRTLREHGLRRGFDLLASRYLADPQAAQYPSPIRYGWALLMALTGRRLAQRASLALAPLALAWAVLPLAGWQGAAVALVLGLASPLLWVLGRRDLQDAPVAALTLVATGFALRGEPVGLALTLAALLACKEAAALMVPALALGWEYTGHAPFPLFLSLGAAAALWALGAAVTLRGSAVPVLRRALRGHDTDYTRQHQSGLPHRLFVDLALLSPMVVLYAAMAGGLVACLALVIVAAHMSAPVQNVRNVLAAELLLRASVAAVVFSIDHWSGVVAVAAVLFAFDLLVWTRLRKVYDPVTSALTGALGMSPKSG